MRRPSLIFLLFISGCTTGNHLVTGTIHVPIPRQIAQDVVQFYQTNPPQFEVIGIVTATCPDHSQMGVDEAVHELKYQAAEIGANGIILSSFNPGTTATGLGFGMAGGHTATAFGSGSSSLQLTGQAIYIPPQQGVVVATNVVWPK